MVSINDLFEYELYHQGKSPHTVRSYLSKIKYFLKWREKQYGITDSTTISALDIKRYESHCKYVEKYTPGSIRQRLSVIYAYCDFLATNEKRIEEATGKASSF